MLLLMIKAVVGRTTINRTFRYLINQDFSVINLIINRDTIRKGFVTLQSVSLTN